MNQLQRDELLIRIDERMKAIKDGEEGDIPEIKKHLDKLNAQVLKNSTFRKLSTWVGSTLGIIIIGTCLKILIGG